jgi:hypothetical protein
VEIFNLPEMEEEIRGVPISLSINVEPGQPQTFNFSLTIKEVED